MTDRCFAAGAALLAGLGLAAAEEAGIAAVPTFTACGIEVAASVTAPAAAPVLRARGADGAWLAGLPMFPDPDGGGWRGSLVGLAEGGDYQAEVAFADGAVRRVPFTTWSATVPIARTIPLAEALRGGVVVIHARGSAAGWIRYDGSGLVVAPAADDPAEAAVRIENASHVIIDHLTVRGGRRHGVVVRTSEAVRIQAADIAGWGRTGAADPEQGGKYRDAAGEVINNDAGVFIDRSAATVVERTWIHQPRGTANPWDPAHPKGFAATHPSGPNAIYLRAAPRTVIRWCDLVGGDGHRWNDAIEGADNGAATGGFQADGDVQGNLLAFGQDDGIELDGGQANLRLIGNRIEGFLCGASLVPNLRGPSYVLGNLIAGLGDENGRVGSGLKIGGGARWFRGGSLIAHNTLVVRGAGIGGGGYGKDADQDGFRVVTRNNVIACPPGADAINDKLRDAANDCDHDLYSGGLRAAPGVEAHGMAALPGFLDPAAGDWRLRPGSVGMVPDLALPGLDAAPASRGAWFTAGRSLPERPLPARIAPASLRFAAPADGERVLRLSAVGAPAGWRGAFRVETGAAAAWLSVQPAAGVLEAGGELALRVAFHPAAGAHGRHHGAVLVRFADGLSLPVLVRGERRDPGVAQRLVLADGPEPAPPFRRQADAGALAGTAVLVAEGAQGGGRLSRSFTLAAGGRWWISARLRSDPPVDRHDSLFVAIDDGEPRRIDLASGAAWSWSPLLAADLAPGPHALHLLAREDGVHLDTLAVDRLPWWEDADAR